MTKRSWVATRVEELPYIRHRAFSTMLTGRPGPAHIEVPMDVQAEAADVSLHDLARRLPVGLQQPDPLAIDKAVDVLRDSRRPVIVVGGGAITSDSAGEQRVVLGERALAVPRGDHGDLPRLGEGEHFAGRVGRDGAAADDDHRPA